MRGRLASTFVRDTTTRERLALDGVRDTTTRGRLASAFVRDTTTRGRLASALEGDTLAGERVTLARARRASHRPGALHEGSGASRRGLRAHLVLPICDYFRAALSENRSGAA
jgi:hypothetical protein